MTEPAHQLPNYWTLDRLRIAGFAFPIPPFISRQDFEQVRPGQQRKVYPTAPPRELFLYRPTRFRAFEDDMPSEVVRSAAECSGQVDARPMEELDSCAHDAIRQILTRAAAGDEMAMRLFVERVHLFVRCLELLQTAQPEKLRALAAERSRWPVLLSLNPQDMRIAQQRLRDLTLGEKALAPTRSNQRTDRRIFWTRMAQFAVSECDCTRVMVPILASLAASAGVAPKRIPHMAWRTPLDATCYFMRDGCICIADWEKLCLNLSKPITKTNFKEWWEVVRRFAYEYWDSSPAAYASALKIIGQPDIGEAIRRNMAFDRLEQALRGLTGAR